MHASDYFPEWECVKNGDPFIKEIVTGDDLITDYRYNFEWFGWTADEGKRRAVAIERTLVSYELQTLYAWWALEA